MYLPLLLLLFFLKVPKSCQIKQSCEPSYSTILQNNPNTYSNIESTQNLRRKPHQQQTSQNNSNPIGIGNIGSGIPGTIVKQQHHGGSHHNNDIYKNYYQNSGNGGNNGEFIPGRIYENQKINVTTVQRPIGLQQQQQSHIYSNSTNNDIIPPPPPPLNNTNKQSQHQQNNQNQNPVYSNIGYNSQLDYQQQHQQHNNELDDEFPPPPSPVSSSYSELRRATDNTYPSISVYDQQPLSKFNNHHQHHTNHNQFADYSGYSGSMIGGDISNSSIIGGISSNNSTTYESIYEPINPRPNSQMSTRSNYSLYTPYINDNSSTSGGNSGDGRIGVGGNNGGQSLSHKNNKEAEVDALTNMLVNSMDNIQDVDSYGICVKCDERIVGENSGCTAMDQIYHIDCFTCYHCQINLQGKPFYSLDGKPYCEEDYLNTLEKCSVCVKPILERILRATGKPYHPGCFCCVVCGKSLDGIPFTVDATNQIHCIDDFHK